ncbi:hypothetical protein [Acinetobacter baumannii]|uniref:hypothetical protein n=1 Tax=Acinetobacter baumannii TaxID=470 RepID=UPI0005F982C0|nr:hypothetical protein [Acinetobacter baumannii]KAF0597227.1 hypothetical protein AB71190_03930 [Acinetobacter baumannii]KJX74098.1 hypothetical protein WH42_01850 [Acinetobacter baumannii]MBF6757018.1 hypothetical protein [Acinetobacter baumannii]
MIDLANQRAALMAQVAEFKKDCMELWFVPELAASYSNRDFFSYSIIEDNQAFFMIEQARQLWSFWNKAKAQAVPETHLLIPKEPNRKTIMAMACVCLGAVGSGPEFLTLKEAKDVYSALVEKESGAEG